MSESTISKNIRAALVARGARPIKYHGGPYSEAGIPDLLVCYRGRFLFIETKQPGEGPTPIQLARMRELASPPYCAEGCTAENVEEAVALLDRVDRHIALDHAPPKQNGFFAEI